MPGVRLLPVALLAVLTLTGCGGDPEVPEIDWSDYSSDVRDRLEQLEEKADCGALQDEFDQAETNGNTDLMTYIDEALERAGCY